ncbi:DUF3341 domain-containing protein [bacterium]|nr:DUF3341 domain-containing protein [bacterium]
MSRRLHSVVALFKSPDAIINAAEKTVEAGYQDFDVHTPYPVHGMDHAMKLKGTKLPYVSLVFALIGFIVAVLFQWYTLGNPLGGIGSDLLMLPSWLERYPFVIGGKPLFSLPAFVPVMFELTVLFCALATAASMIMFFCNLPGNSHPLHDTEYMRSVSSDHFGLCIEASDPSFDEASVKTFLEDVGGAAIQSVRQPYKRPPSFLSSIVFFGILLAVIGGVSTKFYLIFNKVLYMAPWTWMETQKKLMPQEASLLDENKKPIFKDGRGMQRPVEGTVARGFMPYQFSKTPDQAGRLLTNPLVVNEANLTRGKEMYQIYCALCHGDFGKGDGKVSNREAAKGLRPPSLHSKKMKGFSDGRIYHVIVEGQNAMPSYAKQIKEQDRWSIILYLRALQRAVDAKESDLK